MSESNVPNFDKLSDEAKENISKRELRVFISSTFDDMQDERNRLLQDVFLRFRKLCKARAVRFVPIDFRWGIPETQVDKGHSVGICLKHIQRSRPFFIGLLGLRYGSTENNICDQDLAEFKILKEGVKDGLSVTEMEFQFAALKEETQMEACFWLRSEKMPTPKEFQDGEPKRSKLINLKDKLREQNQYPVAEYDSPEDLGNQVEDVLKKWLDKYFPEEKRSTWQAQQDFDQRVFELSRQWLYEHYEFDYGKLNKFVASKEQTLVVVGASGTGKSSLLANWKDVCEKNFPKIKVVSHYVSASENSDLPVNILRRLIVSIDSDSVSEEMFKRMKHDDYPYAFYNVVKRYLKDNPEKRLLFIVDGLNQLSDAGDFKELHWAPQLPEGAQYVFSTITSDPTFETSKRMGWNFYEIPALDPARILRITKLFLEDRGKRLTPEWQGQEDKISDFKLASKPLVLRTLLEELCVFGVFRKFDKEIDRYVGAIDENDFFGKVFERLETNEQFIVTDPVKRREIVEKLSLLIALSRFGLTENELCNVSDLPQVVVFTFLCALDAQLVIHSGRYSFSHDNIRQAALKRYAEKIDNTRHLLIDRFLKSEVEEEHRLQEVPYQYWKLEAWENLRLFLLDFKVLHKLYDKTFNCDFCTYWNAATRTGRKEFRFDLYLKLTSPNPSDWFNLGCISDKYQDFSTAEQSYLKALEIQRGLVEKNPDAYKFCLAETLNQLALLHKNTNRLLKAEEEYSEVSILTCELVKETPNKYIPDLVVILNNLGELHTVTNSFDDAEKEYKMALGICRELVKEKTNVYTPHLAMTLNGLGLLHHFTNRLSDSELEYKEALSLYRDLVKANPYVYTPDLSTILNNLANLHSITNYRREAESEFQEALSLCRVLVKENPIAYKPELAKTLNNLAILHNDMNRLDDAEKDYKEALNLYRELAKKEPNAYKPYVALTLNNIAGLYYNTKRFSEADPLYEKALSLYRELAKENPNTYNPNLALTLNNWATLHKSMNRFTEAEREYEEALEIRRNLTKENPYVYKPRVAETLNDLAILHKTTNRPNVAEKEYKEALGLCRELARENPNVYKPNLAMVLNNLAILLLITKRYIEAKPLLEESILSSKEFAPIRPDCKKYLDQARELLQECEKNQGESNEETSSFVV